MATIGETTIEVRPFHVDIPDEAVEDLLPSHRQRCDGRQGAGLRIARRACSWPTIQELAGYWATDYDWRRCEAKLNALPQFKTEIDGLDIHFIHVQVAARGRVAADHDPRLAGLGDRAARGHRPAHGSRPRTADAPRTHSTSCCHRYRGTAFRPSRPSSAGIAGRVAQAWPELMHRLGYTRYVAQGGD